MDLTPTLSPASPVVALAHALLAPSRPPRPLGSQMLCSEAASGRARRAVGAPCGLCTNRPLAMVAVVAAAPNMDELTTDEKAIADTSPVRVLVVADEAPAVAYSTRRAY